jgi:hypothetical protein
LGSLGYIETSGKVWTGEAASIARKLGVAEAGERYLSDVAAAVGGSVRHYLKPNTNGQILRADGRVIDIATLLDHQDDWLKAIGELNAAVAEAAERGDA